MEKLTPEEEKAMVTMCLTGYRDVIQRLTTALIVTVVACSCIVGGFLWYLSQYEVQVNSYGTIENSKINAHTGQQADTLNNYYQTGANKDGKNQK